MSVMSSPKKLGDVASVDLIDDEDEALGRLRLRCRHHPLEEAVARA